MKIRIVAFTKRGCMLAQDVCDALKNHECEAYSKTTADAVGTERIEGPMSKWVEESFRVSDAIVFVGATGIAVRYISPYLKNKAVDPAIISMDEKGHFVISLLSGHIGGANYLAKEIAKGVNATPIVTTSTDVNNKFSVDTFAARNNLHIGSMTAAKDVSSQIVDEKTVGLVSDVPIAKDIPPELSLNGKEDVGIFISHSRSEGPFKNCLKLTPRCHILGIGCRRGASLESMESFVEEILVKENISTHSIRVVASIDIKRDEVSLLEFAKKIHAEIVFFSCDELKRLHDMWFTPSEFVKDVTGVDNVCERAAFAASRNGEIIVRKTIGDGITLAIVREPVYFDLMRE